MRYVRNKLGLLFIISLLCIVGLIIGQTVFASTPIVGLEKVTIDGVEIVPGTPLCDSRPLFNINGEPVKMEVVAWDSNGNRMMTIMFSKPLVSWISVTIPLVNQNPCIFELCFDCPPLFGDVNRDGVVDYADLYFIKSYIGQSVQNDEARVCDLNRSGTISSTDMAICKLAISLSEN